MEENFRLRTKVCPFKTMQDVATTFDSVLENGSFYSYNGTISTNNQINLNYVRSINKNKR